MLLTEHNATAQDSVRETWLRARSDANTYVAKKVSFSTWLHKILYNLCIDNVRRVQRRLPEPADAENEDQP
ncbi:MAG: hypothetical protein CMQ44_00525 [Gammaproteobacteria bacterium]|nr:hypothetical protein [Gammaproteobacteria bacterium]